MNRERDTQGTGGISLWKLDRLMQGELPEAEAMKLREEVSRTPEAQRYLEKYSQLQSNLSWEKIKKATRRENSDSESFRQRLERVLHIVLPKAGGLKVAMGAAFVVAIGIGVWTFRLQETGSESPINRSENFRSKGSEEAKIHLVIHGVQYEPGVLAEARAGDTMGLAYLSPMQIHAQIWYREGEGALQPMTGAAENLVWPADTRFQPAKQEVVLEGNWERQMVWVVWSPKPFSSDEAKAAIGAERTQGEVHPLSFRLVQPARSKKP